MQSSWSFPTSPRNPDKILVELGILSNLIEQWKKQGKKWKPETTQIEFGEALRASGETENKIGVKQNLYFEKQAEVITPGNLAWTARARLGTFKFLGLVYITENGFVDLTKAGHRLISTKHPDIVMLKQLIKWQYPDNQHKGKSYAKKTFNIWPFIAVTQLIYDLGGLTKNELALFCFTMTTMKSISKTRKAIAIFRDAYAHEKGKIPKRKLVAQTRRLLKEQAQERGEKIPIDAFRDYADALGRYMRYTGLFSINGNRIVITKGREKEVEDILKLKIDLYPYDDRESFYNYYGNPDLPMLAIDVDPTILQEQVRNLASELIRLQTDIDVRKSGISRESSLVVPVSLSRDIEELRTLLYNLREDKKRRELELIDITGRGPEKLQEALNFYDNIIKHQTFDDATYLEWNTWRIFIALNHAKKVKPNLIMDENLEPVNPALGGGPDIEVSFEDFHIIPEVTMRRGTNQAYYETYPVVRHIDDFMQRVNDQITYGLFIAPHCHDDTYHQFFVNWKHGSLKGTKVKVVPLTIEQFRSIVQIYIKREFQPAELRRLFEQIDEALLNSQNTYEWKANIPSTIERWKQEYDK